MCGIGGMIDLSQRATRIDFSDISIMKKILSNKVLGQGHCFTNYTLSKSVQCTCSVCSMFFYFLKAKF